MNRAPFFVVQRSEISNFYTDLKEVINWGLNLEMPRKERERAPKYRDKM